MNHTSLLEYLDREDQLRPVRTTAEWDLRRRRIMDAVGEVMGEVPPARGEVRVEGRGEIRTEGYTRRSLYFSPEPGDRVPAYLLVPHGSSQPRPAILCLHQTTAIGKDEPAGLGGKPSLHYAHELASRGVVCLVPDYPSFGEYPYDFDGSVHPSGVIKAVLNNRRAIDLLESLDEVDPRRIGCIGHSLGGHTGIFTAIHDVRIRAIVSSCGFSSCEKEQERGGVAAWSQGCYMPRVAEYGHMRCLPFDFHELVAALAPRAFLAISPLHDSDFDVDGAREVVAAARGVYALHGAADAIEIRCPDAAHDFPLAEREHVYEFLDAWLRVA